MEREEKIQNLLSRGVENIYPSREFLAEKLKKDEQVTLYLGIDPTGPTLHLGHAIALKKLKEFQDLGHKIILLIGDFTATIGDPTDKTAARKKLTHKETVRNAKLYKKQASALLNFHGRNGAEIKYNSKWLRKLNLGDILELASHMTVDYLLKRDMFERRMQEGKPVYLHEFLYPLLQGYDSVAMKVDGEIGGNDQTFNMLAGRNLSKQLIGKEKFVLTMKLLTDGSGKKMGKTEGNMVSLDQDEYQMFGAVMSWPDNMIVQGFELCTFVPAKEIEEIKNNIESGKTNPRDAKARLAREIVSIYHGKEASERAEKNFEEAFSKGGVPENTQEIAVTKGTLIVDVLLKEGVVKSKTEWRRLVEEGAVTEAVSGEKISDPMFKIEKDGVYKIGKRRFVKVKMK